MNTNKLYLTKTLLLLLMYVQMPAAMAQVAITGSILDENDSPLPAVNVLLLDPADSSMVKGGITDDSGTYRMDKIEPGSYLLSVSMVGFRKHVTSSFKAEEDIVRLDPIRLSEAVEQLGEVNVTARRPLFERQIDRLVVNVQRSITSSGGSVLEVLEKSPGVQVNRQSGDISMSGKSGVRVMINDKAVRVPIDAVVQMLDGMSAANVEQIELITTPPARYEAEGDAGIINIKMSEQTDLGYTGTVGGNLGYNWAETLGGNGHFSRRGRKLAFFMTYTINHDHNKQIWLNSRSLQRIDFLEEITSYHQRPHTTNVQNARLGFEYKLSQKTTAGLLLTGYRRMWKLNNLADNLSRLGPDSTLHTEMQIRETNHWRNSLVNLSLDHAFSEKRNLSMDLDYLYYINDNPSVYQNKFLGGNRSLMETDAIDVEKETPIDIWVGRLDYSDQLSESFTLETGIKGSMSGFFNNVVVSDQIDGDWIINNRYSNEADLTERIGAVYLSGNWTPAEDLQINGGLRYEYTDSYLSTPSREGLIDREYGYLFPSLFINKDLSEDNSIGVSYSRRITRPTFNDMAPFVFFISPNTFISGNPALRPAVTDAIKLDYQHNPWLISLQYSYGKDEIGPFQVKIDPETNEQTYSAENLDYLQTYTLTTSFPVNPVSWWEIQTNISGRYHLYRTAHLEEDVKQKVAAFDLNVTNTMDLPAEMALEISGYYQSKTLWGHLEFRPRGSLNAGIQKRFADGQGMLRLSADDLLYTDIWKIDTKLPGTNTDAFAEFDLHMRTVRLSFTWNFGSDNIKAVDVETGSSKEQERVNTN